MRAAPHAAGTDHENELRSRAPAGGWTTRNDDQGIGETTLRVIDEAQLLVPWYSM
jgi:hypothetical protein